MFKKIKFILQLSILSLFAVSAFARFDHGQGNNKSGDKHFLQNNKSGMKHVAPAPPPPPPVPSPNL
jgi:hypothetical protein